MTDPFLRGQATGNGSRGTWLRDASTAADGAYSFTVAPGCYVLTFFTVSDNLLFANGTMYLNTPVLCVDSGGVINGVDAEVFTWSSTVFIAGKAASTAGGPVADLSIGLFQPNGDGSRGPWLRDTRTGSDGRYNFAGLLPGCCVVTFVAPTGLVFTNASPYLNTDALCLAPGDTLTGIDAQLN